MKRFLATFLTLIALAASARADDALPLPASQQTPDAYRDVGVDQHLNALLPLDARLYDENGQYTSLGKVLSSGRPIVLQLGYLECPGLCDMISREVVNAAQKIDLTIGKDFDFVFVSIDPTDTPVMATLKQNTYVQEYGRPGSAAGFHFLIGKPTEIAEITSVVGFRYKPVRNGQFAHPAVAMIITPDGRISQYLNGLVISPDKLEESLTVAKEQKVGSVLDDFIQICLLISTIDTPHTRMAMTLIRVGGVLTVACLGGAIFWLSKHPAHKDESKETT
jgi:protein SCO1